MISTNNNQYPRKMFYALALAALMITAGCAGYTPFTPPELPPVDSLTVEQPQSNRLKSDGTDFIDQQIINQGEQSIDLGRQFRWLMGCPKEALNVNAFDEVQNSSWFTNRLSLQSVSGSKTAVNYDLWSKPNITQPLTVLKAIHHGGTVRLIIEDSRGDRYELKFDPVGCNGLHRGAEMIGATALAAAGYNVPEVSICFVHPHLLKVSEQSELLDDKGKAHPMSEADLAGVLAEIELQHNGLLRCVASKAIAGSSLGHFQFEGIRKDDPNDLVPHQHRRELRGLYVISSWLNFTDVKASGTMDSFVKGSGRPLVKHYLTNFDAILGSGGAGAQPVYRGYENDFDPAALATRIFSLGMYNPAWEHVPAEVQYPCIGRFHSAYFQPDKFKPSIPNPAFNNLTPRDGFWGAKIVMAFRDDDIRSLVGLANYPDSAAEDYLTKTLIERRDKIGEYWFNKLSPLDDFVLKDNGGGLQELHFDDLAIRYGLADEATTVYRCALKLNGQKVSVFPGLRGRDVVSGERVLQLPDPSELAFRMMTRSEPVQQWEVSLTVKRVDGDWLPPVKIYLEVTPESGKHRIIGLHREN